MVAGLVLPSSVHPPKGPTVENYIWREMKPNRFWLRGLPRDSVTTAVWNNVGYGFNGWSNLNRAEWGNYFATNEAWKITDYGRAYDRILADLPNPPAARAKVHLPARCMHTVAGTEYLYICGATSPEPD